MNWKAFLSFFIGNGQNLNLNFLLNLLECSLQSTGVSTAPRPGCPAGQHIRLRNIFSFDQIYFLLNKHYPLQILPPVVSLQFIHRLVSSVSVLGQAGQTGPPARQPGPAGNS